MKTAIMISLLLIMIQPAFGQKTEAHEQKAVFNWLYQEVDLGKIKQNTPASAVFQFTNGGNVPLIITHVTRSCGCMTSKYPSEAIFVGKTATITTTYDAKVLGVFDKQVTVFSNTGQPVRLRIKGEVIPN